MSTQLRLVLFILNIIVLIQLIIQVKKKKLQLQYIFTWLALLFVLLIVLIFPQLLELFTRTLGVQLPSNMVFFLGFCSSLVIIYILTRYISQQYEQIKELTQKVALIDKEVKGIKGEVK